MKLENIKIQNLFVIAFLFGSINSFIWIIFGYEYIALIISIIIMIVYFFIGSSIMNKKRSISLEQFGDSNYYLGFLFTLVSLSISLINLSTNKDNMDILVSQFGIAIITTLLGLLARIYVINFAPTQDANKESFDIIVSHKLQMIDKQLSQTIDKNIIFSNVIDNRINIFQEHLNRITEDMNKTYEEQNISLHNLMKKIEQTNKHYINNVEKVGNNLQKSETKYNENIILLEKLTQLLDESNTILNQIKSKEKQKDYSEYFEKVIDSISDLKSLKRNISTPENINKNKFISNIKRYLKYEQ
ncbi:MAG: hypothetical protein U9R37_03225 [Campylobacterota bacterium]|nr:hypothetical protein [Campylobacterota bacterium]